MVLLILIVGNSVVMIRHLACPHVQKRLVGGNHPVPKHLVGGIPLILKHPVGGSPPAPKHQANGNHLAQKHQVDGMLIAPKHPADGTHLIQKRQADGNPPVPKHQVGGTQTVPKHLAGWILVVLKHQVGGSHLIQKHPAEGKLPAPKLLIHWTHHLSQKQQVMGAPKRPKMKAFMVIGRTPPALLMKILLTEEQGLGNGTVMTRGKMVNLKLATHSLKWRLS